MQEEDGSIYENVDETMLYIVLLEEMLKESIVWEEITGKESVSTISILAKASEENIDILLLSKAKLSTEIEKLNTDETTKQSIINAVNSGKIGICLTDENVQIWKYTSSTGDYVFYNNGYIQFPERYLYPDTNISVLDIGTFTTRTDDRIAVLKELNKFGYNDVPEGYVLHHDINNGTIQIIRKDIHEQFRHYGGCYYN